MRKLIIVLAAILAPVFSFAAYTGGVLGGALIVPTWYAPDATPYVTISSHTRVSDGGSNYVDIDPIVGFSGPGAGLTDLDWAELGNFPASCAPQCVVAIGTTLTCGDCSGGGGGLTQNYDLAYATGSLSAAHLPGVRLSTTPITGADVNTDILLSTNPAIVKEGQVNTFGSYEQYIPIIFGYLYSENPSAPGLVLFSGIGGASRLRLNAEDDFNYPARVELFSGNMINPSDATGMYTIYKSSHVWGNWTDTTRAYRYSMLNGGLYVQGGIAPASVDLSTTASKSSDNNFSATQTFQYGLATYTGSFSSTATFNSPAQFNGVATSTPAVTNAQYKANMTGAWAYFDGTTNPPTLTSGFNIAALSKNGTGDYEVYFANDFAASNTYVCMCTTGRAEVDDYGDCAVQGLSGTSSTTVVTYNSSTTKTDRARVSILCVGAQ